MAETKYGLTESEFAHILSTFPLVGEEVKSAAMGDLLLSVVSVSVHLWTKHVVHGLARSKNFSTQALTGFRRSLINQRDCDS